MERSDLGRRVQKGLIWCLSGWMVLCVASSAWARKADSPAAKFAWQNPPKFATLGTKEKKRLAKGKVTVKIVYKKNEKGKKMLVTLARGIIKATPKAVFKTVAQLEVAHHFMPRMISSKVVKKLGKNSYHVLRKLKIAWQTIKINSNVTLIAPRRYQFYLLRKLKNDIKDSIGAMTFEPINGGKHTLMTYCNYSDSGRWIPGFIRTPILRGDLPNVVKAIRKRTLSNYTWKKK